MEINSNQLEPNSAVNEARGWPILGVIPQILVDTPKFLLNSAQKSGLTKFRLGSKTIYLVSDPSLMAQVFIAHHNDFVRKDLFEKLIPILGKGILTSEGKPWRSQRRALQSAFQQESIERFAPIIAKATEDFCDRIDQKGTKGLQVDITEEMISLAIKIIFRSLFSTDFTENLSTKGFTGLNAIVGKRIWQPYDLLQKLPTIDNFKFLYYRNQLKQMIQPIIDARLNSPDEHPHDFLTLIIQAKDQNGNTKFSSQDIYDQIISFAFAGHETTAISLSWTLILLLQNPKWLKLAIQEANQSLDQSIYQYSQSDNVLTRIYKESLRMRPPAWFVGRTAIRDINIGPSSFNNGDIVILSPYAVQNNPRYFKNPNQFDPNRFSSHAPPFEKHTYIPFGMGPHTCIGANFAFLEAITIIRIILRRISMTGIGKSDLSYEAHVTLRPKGRQLFHLVGNSIGKPSRDSYH